MNVGVVGAIVTAGSNGTATFTFGNLTTGTASA